MAYPRSFLGLLLTGFTLVAAPLVGALAYSAWHTERLAEQSRKAVFSASQAARASRSLVNRIGSIERLAQQLAVLEAPELSADYVRVHGSFKQVSDELLLLPLEARQVDALKKTVAQEQALYELLTAKPRRRLETRHISRLTGELAENALRGARHQLRSSPTGKSPACAPMPKGCSASLSCSSCSAPRSPSPSRSP